MDQALIMAMLVEPTADEKKNGWTRESLAQYLKQRAAEQQYFAELEPERNPRRAASETTRRFDPHSW